MNTLTQFTPRIETPNEIKAREQLAAAEAIERRLQALRKGRFPERAIVAASDATGPGAGKAKALFPLILEDGLLILLGKTGRGKTTMAVLMAMERQAHGQRPGTYITAFFMFSEHKSTFGGRRMQTGRFDGAEKVLTADALIAGWTQTPFLVIDEIQTRSETAQEDGLLDEIVNARYAAFLPTVLIANFSPEEAQLNLGPRIMDRARECGGIVDCAWDSYREGRK